MKKTTYTLALALLCLGLSACTREYAVFPPHIDVAQAQCTPNGGLEFIDNASRGNEYESCGYKCSRPTGRIAYKATVQCKNGATFRQEFSQ